jgi:pentatricopeptide repeat protein
MIVSLFRISIYRKNKCPDSQARLVPTGLSIVFYIYLSCIIHKINQGNTDCLFLYVHLIRGLCKERKLDDAIKIFLYSLDKGFMLRPRICYHLLNHLLHSKYYKECAVNLIGRMKSFGYPLDSAEYRTIGSRLPNTKKESKEKMFSSLDNRS